MGRSREGAWIEIFTSQALDATARVAPARERGLKWLLAKSNFGQRVAPARERGLKSVF